jgi:hypothetical protein
MTPRSTGGFGALLDSIIYSDECEISFSDVIQIDRNISGHDATSASLRIPYNLQAKYQREVWLYKQFKSPVITTREDDSIAFSTE